MENYRHRRFETLREAGPEQRDNRVVETINHTVSERGLQRGEEHRVQDAPRGATDSARRGDTSPRPKVGDAKREQ